MKKNWILIFSLLCLGNRMVEAQYKVLLDFNGASAPQGAQPYGSLTLSGGKLYGMTSLGGSINDAGNIFSIDTNGNEYKNLFDFNGATGDQPSGDLILFGEKLYGMTLMGGTGEGNIFSIDTNGSGFKNLFNFNGSNGGLPYGSLLLLGNKLYGMAEGGANGDGCIFSIDTNGSGYTILFNFNGINGDNPQGSLTFSGNKFYGVTSVGGLYDSGCIFSIDTNGGGYKKLLDFTGPNGMWPDQLALILSRGRLYGVASGGGAYGIGCIFSIDTSSAGYKDIFDFNGTNGRDPDGSLMLVGSMLYATTVAGGLNDAGVIFSIDTDGGGFTDLFNFNITNGEYPTPLTYSGNVLYGMTSLGGTGSEGVVFGFKQVGLGITSLYADTNEINVYPNPNNGIFTIVLSHAELVSASQPRIEVYNILGEQVFNATLKQVQGDNMINISNEPNGIYLYRVLSETGNLVGEGKLIIQK